MELDGEMGCCISISVSHDGEGRTSGYSSALNDGGLAVEVMNGGADGRREKGENVVNDRKQGPNPTICGLIRRPPELEKFGVLGSTFGPANHEIPGGDAIDLGYQDYQ